MDKIKELYLKYKEIINYLIVGVLTTVVSLTVYYGLVLTILNPKNPIQLQAANIASWICAVAFAYWANRKFARLLSPTGRTGNSYLRARARR